jgi:predicted nucleic acid-binding protein
MYIIALDAVKENFYRGPQAIGERAKQIVLGRRQLSARDAVHVAIMEHHAIEQILTFASGFDELPGITRLS